LSVIASSLRGIRDASGEIPGSGLDVVSHPAGCGTGSLESRARRGGGHEL